jgi:predicted dehydrogenase
VLMVGHVLRFFPEIAELRRVVDAGELGRPRGVSALRLSAPPDWNDWMLDPARSGGTPVDLMLHDFDLALALLGPARRVYARAAEPRHVTAVVEHEAGEAVVEGSHAMPPAFPFTAGLRVLCEHGLIDHRFEAQPADEGGNIGGGASSYVRVYAGGAAREVPAPVVDPWTAEVEHFVGCVEAGAVPSDGSFEQARAALAVALAARRSVESGSVEVVPANVNGGL